MKILEDIPIYICDDNKTNYINYIDTDSIYVNANELLYNKHIQFDDLSFEEQNDKLEEIAKEYELKVNNHYNNIVKDLFNINQYPWFNKLHFLEMKTECVIRRAYFRQRKRYGQWILREEGIKCNKKDYKGLEFKKSNFPLILRDKLNIIYDKVLLGDDKKEIDKLVIELKNDIISGKIPLKDLGNPTSVKTLNKYIGKKDGDFTITKKGTPFPVKSAISYNDLLSIWNITDLHYPITESNKINTVYLKENPYNLKGIAFLSTDFHDKIKAFTEKYADREKIYDSIVRNKLIGLYEDLEWDIDII